MKNQKKIWILIAAIIVIVICFFVFWVKNTKNNESSKFVLTESEYFSSIEITGLKFFDGNLTYNGKIVKGFFDPLEVGKQEGKYVGFVYSDGTQTDGIILLVERNEEGKIVGVKEITQKELNENILGILSH